ncbi:hypothetical protein DASC09_013970 [Saccharomycopsis crataegensis]|uniref:F-box domain-containing protein n=1 Tax=Saccharomycopsis crataegensis TaxID=43959 RepID=A0AAV5QHG7_9ASCO|nr:hypothetical protein DASC09_013970 [Saccharomycopsis crataegensis]
MSPILCMKTIFTSIVPFSLMKSIYQLMLIDSFSITRLPIELVLEIIKWLKIFDAINFRKAAVRDRSGKLIECLDSRLLQNIRISSTTIFGHGLVKEFDVGDYSGQIICGNILSFNEREILNLTSLQKPKVQEVKVEQLFGNIGKRISEFLNDLPNLTALHSDIPLRTTRPLSMLNIRLDERGSLDCFNLHNIEALCCDYLEIGDARPLDMSKYLLPNLWQIGLDSVINKLDGKEWHTPNLKQLHINYEGGRFKVKNLDSLYFPNLKFVGLTSKDATDTGIELLNSVRLDKLQYLEISGKVTGLEQHYLSSMRSTYLKELRLDQGNLDRIPDLTNFLGLEELILRNNNISRIERLEALQNLTFIDLRLNKITKIENLDHLQKLKALVLGMNKIGKIENLQGLTELNDLILDSNKITKIENLHDLQNLQTLSLSNNQITDTDGLPSLCELRTLFLVDNCITEYTLDITNYPMLETAALSGNKIDAFIHEPLPERVSYLRTDPQMATVDEIESDTENDSDGVENN